MKKIFSFCAALVAAMAVNAVDIQVNPGSGTLRAAVASASAGDVLILADGEYSEPEVVELNKNLTIKAADGVTPVVAQQYYMKLLNSAQVTMIGIKFDGGAYNNGQGANDHFIRPYDATADKTLTLIDCEICRWKSFVLYPQRADRCMATLTIENCYFHDNVRSAVYVADAPGATAALPLAELNVQNSTFVSDGGTYKVIDIKNSGAEQKDAKLRIDHCTFYNCGPVRSEKSTDVIISNSIFAAPTASAYEATICYTTDAAINNCLAYNVEHLAGPTITGAVEGDPQFADAENGDLTLAATSPAINAGTDGKTLGDSRWYPKSGTGISNAEVSAKAVKFIENGQLIIMKNGVKYDITGAIVK